MTTKASNDNFQWTNVGNQYFATFAANLVIFSHGAIIGWVSPALPILSSDDTPLLSGPMSSQQVSWIGSINCLGALCGTLSLGYFISLLGCKRAMLILSMPCILFWLFIFFGDQYYHLLLARIASGYAGGGTQTSLILYVSEIANDNIRGRLGSSTQITRNFGVLLGYILGATLPYKYIPLISGIFPIVFAIVFIMLPNTPRHYLRRGQIQEAKKALKFYKGYSQGKSEQEDNAFAKEFERLKSITHENETEEKFKLSDLGDPNVLKGLGIGIALTTFAQTTANFTITNYAVMIFEKAGTSIDPYVSSILLAVALILGSLFSTCLADILGRKILNIISLFGSAFGLFAVSLFHYLNRNGYDLSAFAFVPAASLSFVIFISAAGIMPLSMVCSVEYLPAKVRTCGMAIICFTINLVTFMCVKLFPILLDILDLHGCLMIFAVACIFGAIFVIIVVEETTGQSLDDVGLSEEEKMKRIHVARINSI